MLQDTGFSPSYYISYHCIIQEVSDMDNEINAFIGRFHESRDVDIVFTKGCCYWFSNILHIRFPESTIMYDPVANHFVTKIGDRLFDITGDVTDVYRTEPWDTFSDSLERERIIRDCIMF